MTSADYAMLKAKEATRLMSRTIAALPGGEHPPDDGPETGLQDRIRNECINRGWGVLKGSTAHKTFRTLGEPDLTVVADNRIFFIECKTRTGKLSIEQQGLAMKFAKLGHVVHVVRSLEQFKSIVTTPPNSWRCFHCDQVFTDREKAREHFGDSLPEVAAVCNTKVTDPAP